MGAQGLVLFQITEGSVLVFRVPVDQVFTVVDVLLIMADVLWVSTGGQQPEGT